jgi:AcrR family transcriptional regulator
VGGLRWREERRPDATTLRALGGLVGVSATAAYRHFKDKRDILEALASASLRELNDALEKACQRGSSPVEALKLLIDEYFHYARRFPARYRLMFGKPDFGENRKLGSEARRMLQIVARLVRAAQEAGQLKDQDPDKLAALIIGATHGQADLEQSGQANITKGMSAHDLMPLLLIDLLAQESGVSRTPSSGWRLTPPTKSRPSRRLNAPWTKFHTERQSTLRPRLANSSPRSVNPPSRTRPARKI